MNIHDTVSEIGEPEGYSKSQVNNTTIKNTYIIEKTSISRQIEILDGPAPNHK